MTIFRFSPLAVLIVGATMAQSKTVDASLRAAAKAAIGGVEVRHRKASNPGEITIIKADQLLELPFGPVLVTSVTIKGGSHAEVGALGIYYLKRQRGGYAVQRSWPKAIEGGGFGSPPDWSLSTRFTQFPAIVATAGWTGQGCTSDWSILAELTPERPIISDTIYTSYSYDHLGRARPDKFNGRIANLRKARSFDVAVSGTSKFSEHYLFRNGRFVRTERETRLEC